jgi:two-component system LytT family response regulator
MLEICFIIYLNINAQTIVNDINNILYICYNQILNINKLISAVIVDDEARNIALLSHCLEKYCPQVSLVASFTKKKKAISHLRNNKPDILFLDIVLDSGSGFDILEEIDHEDIRVVMCSAHDEFALKAIRYQVTDYLLKPLEIQDLISTVEKIEKRIAKYKKRQVYDSSHFTSFNNAMPTINQRIAISEKSSVDFVSIDEILCVETHNGTHKTEIVLKHHAKREHIVVGKPLLEMEKKLPQSIFFRVSRTSIVNVTAIRTIHRNVQYTHTLTNGYRIQIPRAGYKLLISFMEKIYQTII